MTWDGNVLAWGGSSHFPTHIAEYFSSCRLSCAWREKKRAKTPRLRQQLTATGMNDPRIRADLGGAGAAVADSRLP